MARYSPQRSGPQQPRTGRGDGGRKGRGDGGRGRGGRGRSEETPTGHDRGKGTGGDRHSSTTHDRNVRGNESDKKREAYGSARADKGAAPQVTSNDGDAGTVAGGGGRGPADGSGTDWGQYDNRTKQVCTALV